MELPVGPCCLSILCRVVCLNPKLLTYHPHPSLFLLHQDHVSVPLGSLLVMGIRLKLSVHPRALLSMYWKMATAVPKWSLCQGFQNHLFLKLLRCYQVYILEMRFLRLQDAELLKVTLLATGRVMILQTVIWFQTQAFPSTWTLPWAGKVPSASSWLLQHPVWKLMTVFIFLAYPQLILKGLGCSAA